MSTLVDIHTPGDVIWVMAKFGEVLVYRVQEDGTLKRMTEEEAWAQLDD